jgi:hypothetical protein
MLFVLTFVVTKQGMMVKDAGNMEAQHYKRKKRILALLFTGLLLYVVFV